jgi:predicted dehydrogenase
MNNRRSFLFGAAAAAFQPSRLVGANDRIRLGIIGYGARGKEIVNFALQCPNTEFGGFADVYTERLKESAAVAPKAKTYLDYRRLLEDRSIDAVLIATPQHLHREHFVAALGAGKHVYQEKTLAFTVDDAKKMREAHRRAPKLVVQVGHQSCSSADMVNSLDLLKTERMGKITEIVMHMFRNTPHDHPQWSRPVTPEMTPEHIIWNAFLGDAPKRPFDPNRYQNWRFFWDYSGGNVYENMCHQLSFWYKALNLAIPTAVNMTGGIYLWKDGREVPDTMTVAIQQPEEMLISWTSSFGNDQLGSTEHVLGTDGTIARTRNVAFITQKATNPEGRSKTGESATPANMHIAHMANFLDGIRTGAALNCPFELGYRVAIACRMTVDSYRQNRPVRWNPDTEQLV